ncbi:MAG TPA: 3-phosphoserine/phosphohydroxythreonine transaminase [Candidatus Ventricola intestinavium]|nr:3-phosphoserine/phosphohydroxythreonine transaminase [Candidatus Ventricola intestinavium]
MDRVFNFAPGPSMLPLPVLKKVQEELLCYADTGMSVMEMSHRSKMYLEIFDRAVAGLRDVMGVPEGYKIMFVQGGATAMFASVPMNLMDGGKADYIDSGNFAHNALVEAQKYGQVVVAGSSREDHYAYIPDYTLSPDARYVHITTNNTVYGTRWDHLPDTGSVPLVADMSSNILSEVYDVSRFGVIYAGAQKNVAPAGVVILIVREDLMGRELPITPKVMSFKKMADADSMLNTPNCFGIYVAGLVFDWIKAQGGVAELEKINIEKAKMLYDFLDESRLFKGTARRKDRSRMNVTFVTGNEQTDAQFVKEAAARGLVNLKGHRIVGGMRASIYNAMPVEGVRALVDFMKEFETKNG